MSFLNFVSDNRGVLFQYLFWTLVLFTYNYIYTDNLSNIDAINVNLNIMNNVIENRVFQVGIIAILIYFLIFLTYKLIARCTNLAYKASKHRVFDSIIKVTLIGSGSSISGTMYAVTLYLFKNPQEPIPWYKFFYVTTGFTLVIIIFAFICYWFLDMLKSEYGIESL